MQMDLQTHREMLDCDDVDPFAHHDDSDNVDDSDYDDSILEEPGIFPAEGSKVFDDQHEFDYEADAARRCNFSEIRPVYMEEYAKHQSNQDPSTGTSYNGDR